MKEEQKGVKKSNTPLVIAIVAVVAVAVIAVVALVASGVFGTKEFRLYDGVNELKPGAYTCVSNGADYVDGYISTDGRYGAADNMELIFRYGNRTSVVVKSGQKIVIWGDDEEVDIVCTKQ